MLVGIVGKPNCGKSTFFKAMTLANVHIDNYPFVTIKPNHGVGHVKIECSDKEFNLQCVPKEGYCINHFRFVPVELLDVAGLVPGAYEGKGMGNQFLDDLRQADVLIHVIDCAGATNEKGEPVTPGSYDPANDIRFLEAELDMWYLQILKKPWERFAKETQQEHADIDKAIEKQFSGLKVNELIVKHGLADLNLKGKLITAWTDDDLLRFATFLRKQTKPIIIAANKIDMPTASDNLKRIIEEFPEYIIVGCSSESEIALKEAAKHGMIDYTPGDKNFNIIHPDRLNEKQKAALEFIRKNVLERFNGTGVQEVIDTAVFKLLKYITAYPVASSKLTDKDGNIMPDCHLIPPNTNALHFAFRIHTDIGNNFIRAIDMKTKLVVGKEHIIKNRDVIEIVTSK